MTWTLAVDASYQMPDPAKLGDIDVIMGYLSDTAGKGLTPAYVARCAAAGKKIHPLAETTSTMMLGGRTAGRAAATAATAIAARLGCPADVDITYAADSNFTTAQMAGPVSAFVQGLHDVVGPDDVYGGYTQLAYLIAHGLGSGRDFQTYAWSAGKWLPVVQAPVEQYRNGVSLAGGTVDLCRIDESKITLWNPGAAMTAVDLTPAAQSALVDAMFNHVVTDGGVNGTLHTLLAKTYTLAAALTPDAIAQSLVPQVIAALPPVQGSWTPAQVAAAIHTELAKLSLTVAP